MFPFGTIRTMRAVKLFWGKRPAFDGLNLLPIGNYKLNDKTPKMMKKKIKNLKRKENSHNLAHSKEAKCCTIYIWIVIDFQLNMLFVISVHIHFIGYAIVQISNINSFCHTHFSFRYIYCTAKFVAFCLTNPLTK